MAGQVHGLSRRLVLAVGLIGAAVAVAAQDGYFDPSWGAGGRVQIDALVPAGPFGVRHHVRSTGQLLLAGTCRHPAGDTICAARLRPDGQADSTFGNGGVRVYDTMPTAYLGALAPTAGGQTLLAGRGAVGVPIIARLTRAGMLDSSVGLGDGFLAFQYFLPSQGGPFGSIRALAVLPDGKVLVAGAAETRRNGVSNLDFAVARLLPDLSGLDPSFGDGGVRLVAFDLNGSGGTGNHDEAYAIVALPNGRILLAGGAVRGTQGAQPPVVARLTAAGDLDSGFGSGGRFVSGHDNTSITAMTVDGKGRIVLSGRERNLASNNNDFYVARVLGHGQAFDQSFGSGGATRIDFASGGDHYDVSYALALQSDGKMVVVGSSSRMNAGGRYFSVARLTDLGALDPAFGIGGLGLGTFAPAPSSGSDDLGFDIAIGNGGLMIAGTGIAPDGVAPRLGVAKLNLDLVFTDGFQP